MILKVFNMNKVSKNENANSVSKFLHEYFVVSDLKENHHFAKFC